MPRPHPPYRYQQPNLRRANRARKRKFYPKKKARRKMALKRSPFTENKINQTPEQSFTLNSANSLIVPDCFEFAVQGSAQNEMTGRYLFSKWVTTKALIDFALCTAEPSPLSYVVTQGWCKLNLNPDPPTTPGAPFPIEADELQQHVANYYERGYANVLGNGDVKNFKIIKRYKIDGKGVNITGSTGADITVRQPRLLKFKWAPMRKIRYNHCVNTAGTTFLQCNQENWIPFINIQFCGIAHTGEHFPNMNTISTHYFTDS